jgi:hypothetical protein
MKPFLQTLLVAVAVLLIAAMVQAYQYKFMPTTRTIAVVAQREFSSRLLAGVPPSPPKERGPPKKKPKDDVIQVILHQIHLTFLSCCFPFVLILFLFLV